MKKLLALLICLATVFSFVGCTGQAEDKTVNEASNVIDLGGGLGTITPEGDAYGTYKKIETPKELVFEDAETTVYEDLNSDTPYIAVFRFAKNGYTLEAIAQEESDLYCNGYYQMFEDKDKGFSGAYFCHPYVINGNYYYTDTRIVEDGDDFVEVSFFGKTEELQIGDTNVYAYVPVGYTSYMDDDYKAHGAIFASAYSEEYYFPFIYVGKWDYSYDFLKWYYEEDYPDGLPMSEEEHAQLVERANNGESVMHDFYELLDYTIDYDSYQDEKQSFDYNGGYYVLLDDQDIGTEAWFEVDGNWYITWLGSDLNPKPAYAIAFLSSLHTK